MLELRKFSWLISVLFTVAAVVSHAGEPSAAAVVFQTQCSSCHGADARGAEVGPSLAGQQADYLSRQLLHFQSGLRGGDPRDAQGAMMAATAKSVAASLSDVQLQALMVYLSELSPSTSAVATDGDLRRGANYYNASCGGCHGAQAQGNPLMHAPRLAGLSGAYLQRQFQHFAQGVRGTHKEDRLGRQMKMMATTLPDAKTLADVIAFITAQP